MTAPVVAAADTRFATVTMLELQLVDQAKAEWYRLQLADLQGSFVQRFVPAMVPGLTSAQTVAANLGAQAIGDVTGRPVSIIPGGFAGYASDGRSLSSLLAQPLIGLYHDLDNGVPAELALARGMDSMDRILATQVHDAARQAESVQMVEHRVTYYVRQVEPGACGRCLILAGKHYKVNDGFLRHVHCRCYHVPEVATYLDPVDGGRGHLVGTESPVPFRTFVDQSAREIFDALSEAEQNAAFTIAGARAIRLGANIPQIVNSRRQGMSTATDRYGQKFKTTTVGAKRGKTRLLPEAIFRLAGNDHAYAIRLLISNGYIRG